MGLINDKLGCMIKKRFCINLHSYKERILKTLAVVVAEQQDFLEMLKGAEP